MRRRQFISGIESAAALSSAASSVATLLISRFGITNPLASTCLQPRHGVRAGAAGSAGFLPARRSASHAFHAAV
jgi:hypothetical protein